MRNIMCKDLIVVDVESSLEEVSKIMKQYDVGFVPVSKGDKIIGVLTDRDIVVKILSNKDNKIEGYLSKPIYVDINEDIESALNLMKEHKIKRLLVSENNKLVGIVSLSDLLNTNIDTMETIKEIFEINRNTDTYITKINEFYL